MLGNFPLNPVLPAQNGDRARAFYRDVLGLTLLSGPDDDPMMFRAGIGTTIVLTELPDRCPATLPDDQLHGHRHRGVGRGARGAGAQFQPLDPSASFAGTSGVAVVLVMDFGPVKSAFLVDTEGNVLALNEIEGRGSVIRGTAGLQVGGDLSVLADGDEVHAVERARRLRRRRPVRTPARRRPSDPARRRSSHDVGTASCAMSAPSLRAIARARDHHDAGVDRTVEVDRRAPRRAGRRARSWTCTNRKSASRFHAGSGPGPAATPTRNGVDVRASRRSARSSSIIERTVS